MCEEDIPMGPEGQATMSRDVYSGEKDATGGDATGATERLSLGASSGRLVVVHRPGDSALENGGPAVHPGPGLVQIGHMAPAAAPLPREETTLEGEVRQVSVLMADLRGFTTFCERVPPERILRVLNEYLTAMIDVILKQHGRVQDFVGDGILGVFGAPGQDPDHAWHAVLSALEMQLAIRWLNGRWEREGGTAFGLGVAVHTGEVFAGTVGSPKQRKYAVVGDPVNTVARLEKLNRDLDTEIVMTGDALALVRDRVDVHPRGSFPVPGRSHAVEVFEVLGVQRALAPVVGSIVPASLSLA
jgi:class 3 adenylate cyclase